jgi:hypothetical protein
MAMLLLNRTFELVHDDGPACVICAPRAGISAGWCARIAVDPAKPDGLWMRRYLQGVSGLLDGREVVIYNDLVPGDYEAHSCLRSRIAQSAYFAVGRAGAIAVLGRGGDEDLVLARLHGITPDALRAARAATAHDDLYPLEGTIKQVAWATRIRADLIAAAVRAGDHALVARLRQVRDATWFIANRDRAPDRLCPNGLGA